MASEISRAAVYSDNDWGKEVVGLKSMSIRIDENSDVIGAPVETGHTSFDNKVNRPATAIVSGKIILGDDEAEKASDEIGKMIANRKFEFYSVCDGFYFLNNLILRKYSTERKTDEFDFIDVKLEFVEALLIQKQSEKPLNSENSNIRNNGFVSGVNV